MTAPENIKETAKKEIQALIDKYLSLKKAGQIETFNEQATCDKLILPLFEALGWDIQGKKIIDEVKPQAPGGGQKRVDYAFQINSAPVMFLEAKQLSEDLDDPRFARQTINYGYHRNVRWVILSDFEGIKVFNATLDTKEIRKRLIINLKYTDYLPKFDELWLLSKESLFNGDLNNYAAAKGHVINREPINEVILKKLLIWRNKLIKSILDLNSDASKEEAAECTQRLLNRLIFIRTCEDRGFEGGKTLMLLNKEWQDNSEKRLHLMLRDVFADFNKGYDSSLFERHMLDGIKISDDLLHEIIKGLYEDREEEIDEFNFAAIDADILGSIYEQYLGTIQKGESAKDKEKRKSHGIYYTPKYIVDYIVKNTLGKVLDDLLKNKEYAKIGQLKVLDPACGSGSFLLKTLEMFDDAYAKTPEFAKFPSNRKIKALCNNIYGVDLDNEAVELTKLNLLLSSTYSRKKLPPLGNNIEQGNSLIDDPKIAGDKAFKWETRFKNVMDKGGFDVIIGNPPYIRNRELANNDKNSFVMNYLTASGQFDIYQLFFEKAINLLKDSGYLAFITSNKYTVASYGEKLREFILNNCEIIAIIDVSNIGVFKDASTYPYIIILRKASKISSGHKIRVKKVFDEPSLLNSDYSEIKQSDFQSATNKSFIINIMPPFFEKMESLSINLAEIATIKETIHTGNIRDKLVVDEKMDVTCKKLLAGKDCHRYWFEWNGRYIRYNQGLIVKSKNEYASLCAPEYFENPKILLREIAQNIECCFDDQEYYTLNKVYSVQKKADAPYAYEYILGLLNSKLLSFYFRQKYEEAHVSGGYLQFKKIYTSQIPIRRISFKNPKEKRFHDDIVVLVDKILDLQKQFLKVKDKQTSKTERLKRQIEETDQEIDNLVYRLYGLTPEEIKVVEGEK